MLRPDMELESPWHCHPGGPLDALTHSPHFSNTLFPHPESVLPKTLQEFKTLHVQEQIILRIPGPLHRTREKIATTSLALSSSPKELLNLIWKQLGDSSSTGNQTKKKAQSVPGRVRQLEPRDRKLRLERAQARNSHAEEEALLAFLQAQGERENLENSGEGSNPRKSQTTKIKSASLPAPISSLLLSESQLVVMIGQLRSETHFCSPAAFSARGDSPDNWF